jgi:hypothetical protein
MKELTELLGQLAAKLGTSVEKLWAVLLKQAPISGTIDLLICIGMVIFSVWAFRFVKDKTAKHEMVKDHWRSIEAEWEDEGAFLSWVAVGAFFLLTIICVDSEAEIIMAAFFNPEYWALTKILSKVK